MRNKTLQILLKLKDEATKRLKGFHGNMIRTANSLKKAWVEVIGVLASLKGAGDLIELNAQMKQSREAFDNLMLSAGASSQATLEAMRKASAGTISDLRLMEQASQAVTLGLDPQKMAELMNIARASARAFGKDVDFMFESLVTGIGRQSKLMLDNLGIIISAEDAYKKYAEQIGKNVNKLTDFEKRQAFTNAVLEKGNDIVARVNIGAKSQLEKIQALKAGWQNLREAMGAWIFTALQAMNVLTKFTAMMVNKSVVGLVRFAQVLIDTQTRLITFFNTIASKLPGIESPFQGIIDKLEMLKVANDTFINSFEQGQDDMALSAIESWRGIFDAQNESLKAIFHNVQDNNEKVKIEWKAQEEFAKQSARNIQNAFSDFFFKAFTGELTNLKDVFADFGRSILRMLSNIIAKMLIMKALKTMAGSSGTLFGLPINDIFHSGGIVKAHSGRMMNDERLIKAQAGEGILSRAGMSALGRSNFNALNRGEPVGGGQTIQPVLVIKAWDASDVMSAKEKIQAMMVDALRRAQPLRGAIKQYG